MSRRILYALFVLPVLCFSCTTTSECNSTGVPTASEVSVVKAYLDYSSTTATYDPRGFYYQIINPGTGATVLSTSSVRVRYTGTLITGTVFDSNQTYDGTTLVLASLVKGWQEGLPLIKQGGKIVLYLPAALGYGCKASGIIPANSPLIFTVELLEVI